MNPWWRRPAPSESTSDASAFPQQDDREPEPRPSSGRSRSRGRQRHKRDDAPAEVVSSSDVVASALLDAESSPERDDELPATREATEDSQETRTSRRPRRRRRRRRSSSTTEESRTEEAQTRESSSETVTTEPETAGQEIAAQEAPTRRRGARGGRRRGRGGSDSRVAVFVDLGGIDLGPAEDSGRLDQLEQWLGTPQVEAKRAYRAEGDTTTHDSHRSQLRRLAQSGTELIEVDAAGRPAMLVQLTADAIELCLEQPEINTIALVSSHPDLVPLAAKLRDLGRRVVVLGEAGSDEGLLTNCDAFYSLDQPTEPTPKATEPSEPVPPGESLRAPAPVAPPQRELVSGGAGHDSQPEDSQPESSQPESRETEDRETEERAPRRRRPRRRRRTASTDASDAPSDTTAASEAPQPSSLREPHQESRRESPRESPPQARREPAREQPESGRPGSSQRQEASGETLEGSDPLSWIAQGLDALAQGAQDRISSTQLQQWIRRRRPDFNEHALGYDCFGDMLRAAEHPGQVAVVVDERTGLDWVALGATSESD